MNSRKSTKFNKTNAYLYKYPYLTIFKNGCHDSFPYNRIFIQLMNYLKSMKQINFYIILRILSQN